MAIQKPSYDSNRKILRDVVPLSGPLSMYIEPTRLCNFKCFYCMHSTRGMPGGLLDQTGVPLKHIDDELFRKVVKNLLEFPEQLKRITFSGLGEPLMNPKLPDMVRYLREQGFIER
jgi:MoaA/NifB/PqqE/SkfB family radical SAM enzyme